VAGVQGTIELPFSELADGLWFIEGANGAGKSTILEAIAWCQFGEFLRSGMKAEFAINDAALERGSGGGASCLVRIDFANGYSIERIRHGKKKTQSVQVFKNGVRLHELEKGEVKESQKAIEMLLGTNFQSFARTVL
jgi:DNA repair exonuclease SbcCD ATPase subunit